ncbi:MAG: hypothetical protein VXY56_06100, partial [Pseudomonadota bacterium]|nr:hypothetical protein [Pseudomonadota bacterium]
MTSIKCPIPNCDFEIGEETQDDCKGPMLQLHLVHHQNQLKAAQAVKPEPISRPTLTSDISEEDWNFFLSQWQAYKNATMLSGPNLIFQLSSCCDKGLNKALNRVHGSSTSKMSENELLDAIKQLAVKEESLLVARYKLHCLKQDIGEPIQNYVARIKGQAKTCKLFASCPECNFSQVDYSDQIMKDVITKGIVDDEIRSSLLGERNQEMTLDEIISYIKAKEMGKLSTFHLLGNASTTAATSRYRKNKKQFRQKKCNYCGDNADHGSNYNERQKRCKAFQHVCKNCQIMGHFESVCRRKQLSKSPTENQRNNVVQSDSTSDGAVFDALCASKHDVICVSNSNRKMFCTDTLDHYVYNNIRRCWELRPSDPQPTLLVNVCVSKSLYRNLNLSFPVDIKVAKLTVIADTGCQSCLAGINILPLLGLTRRNLLRCTMKMNSANNMSIHIYGALPLKISTLSPSNKLFITK